MGVFLFVAFWVVLGLTLVIIALGGGPRRARERMLQTESARGRRLLLGVLGLASAAFGVVLPTLVIAGNTKHERAGTADIKLSASERRGQRLFGERCNQCHVLAAAGTNGLTGTNLDELKPPKSLVLDAIAKGRARGAGRMPAQLVRGEDAEDVAAFVAKVAGKQQD